jgi:hypothetical protein
MEDPRRIPAEQWVYSAALWRAGKLAVLGYVLVGAAVGLAIHDLSNANRAHELELVPYCTGLAIAGVAVCVLVLLALRSARRAGREGAFRPAHWVPLCLAWAYVGLVVLPLIYVAVMWLVGVARSASN